MCKFVTGPKIAGTNPSNTDKNKIMPSQIFTIKYYRSGRIYKYKEAPKYEN